MPRRARTGFAAILLLACATALASCGDSHTRVSTGTYAGESGAQAPYLDVGSLIYEVQLSRQLNPLDTEDAAYLQGLAPLQSTLGSREEWFAVFVQVYNNSSQPQPPSRSLTISDTQGNVYAPFEPNGTNPFAYRPEPVPAKGRLPLPDSTAAAAPTQGTMLLYKIKIASLGDRPLTITIVDPTDSSQRASAELDV
jgi:hypothetical protein